MEFSRQEYWSGLPFPTPGDLPDPGIKPYLLCLLHWQVDSLPQILPFLKLSFSEVWEPLIFTVRVKLI